MSAFLYFGPDNRCEIGGRDLHCGDCFQIKDEDGNWLDVRIERHRDWVLVFKVTTAPAQGWSGADARFFQ